MRTFQKAREIFNNQLNKSNHKQNSPFVQKNKALSLRFNSTTLLYKVYLHNKIVRKRLKTFNLLPFLKKNNVSSFIIKNLVCFSKIKSTSLLRKRFLKIKDIVKKYNFEATFDFLVRQKNLSLLKLVKTRKNLKSLLLYLKFLIFSNFFERQVFYLKEVKKNLGFIRDKTKGFELKFRTFKVVSDSKLKLEEIIFTLKNLVKSLIVNFYWSKRLENSINEYRLRITTTLCFYFVAFMILINNSLYCLKDSVKNKVVNTFPLLIKAFLPIFEKYSLSFSILYISLFLKPKNILKFPKNTIGHLGVCSVIVLINFGVEISNSLINYIMKSIILFMDIFVCRFFFKTDKKTRFLRNFTDILTSEADTTTYYFSKIFKPALAYSIEFDRYVSFHQYYSKLGRYEKLTEKLLIDSSVFLKSYIHLPFYLILITSLLYNCCYYIIYNKQPYIPIITDLVKKLTPNNENN